MQPDYVFIGNSICESRIDAGPSFLSTWRIWLKSFAAANMQPKKVLISGSTRAS